MSGPNSELNAAQKEFLALQGAMGWSDAECARQIGKSRSAVSQIRSGKNTPTVALEKLREVVLQMRPNAKPVKEAAIQISREKGGAYWGKTFMVPIISWASAGNARAYEDQGHDVPHIPSGCKDPNCYALEIEGSSMEPIYLAGDVAVVAPNSQACNGDLVIAKLRDDSVYFKQLKFSTDLKIVRLFSFNPHHPVMDLKKSEIRFLHPIHSVTRVLKKNC